MNRTLADHGLEVVALGIFLFWALASGLVYFPRWKGVIRNWDLLSLIPEWRFFAPTPARYDYVLLYRDLVSARGWGGWHQLVSAGSRQWWHCVWNPQKRGNKALFDQATELSQLLNGKRWDLEISNAYLFLLNAVSAEPRLEKPQQTQFMILMQNGAPDRMESKVLYLSGIHDL